MFVSPLGECNRLSDVPAELWCRIIALIRLTLVDDAAIKQREINENK